MLKQADVPAISKAIDGLYVMNDNDRLKELARMREKAMHDRASELEEAMQDGRDKGIAEGMAKGIAEGMAKGIAEGMAKGRAERDNEIFAKMKAYGLSDSDIQKIFSIEPKK